MNFLKILVNFLQSEIMSTLSKPKKEKERKKTKKMLAQYLAHNLQTNK